MSQPALQLNDFTAFISREVNDILKCAGDSGFREAAFTQLVMDYMADGNETGNTQVCTIIHRNKAGSRLRQMNGYGLWDNYETLDIFIVDYKGDGNPYTLERNRASGSLNLALRYINHLFKGDTDGVEDSAAEKEFIQNFHNFKKSILRIRVILLTDGIVKKDVRIEPIHADSQTIVSEVWDMERICQLWSSQHKREPIEIDIPEQFGQKIRCLSVEQVKDNYSSYLCIVPADLLADLYDKYGSRLLEQNVRVYLQNLGKVNKEIRRTILEDPGMFMAYNNGISATATNITFEKDRRSGTDIIKHIKDLQIVNGGQTTSSLYYARKKDRATLSQVNVQMKLTLVQDDRKMEEVISSISRYANSQNKVSETDLTSNQAFHITMEELSRTTWAAPLSGNQQTRWYYERVKGQYREEMNKEHTEANKRNFRDRNPQDQVIRKDEFSKFRNAWHQIPYWVARGSQKNYMHFIEAKGEVEPTREYFRDTIAIAILFKAAEQIYGKKPYAMGDLRYLVVPYTLAWLNYHTTDKLDLEKIWKLQQLPDALNTLLKAILLKVNDFLQENKPQEYALISEWAKKEDCWTSLKKISPQKWGIDIKIIRHLLNKGSANRTEAVSEDKATGGPSVSSEKWEAIEQFGKETGKLSPIQIGAVRNIISRLRKQKTLSEQLVSHGYEALSIYTSHRKS